MKNSDADMIRRTLEGDQQAFTVLVEKYQKQVHALAWQKIGDFHIAQEIAQDTFLTTYQKLETLTHHSQLAGWLYVITNNKCKNWYRQKRLALQSLETTDPVEIEEVYYSEYMTQQREEAAKQKRRAVVQKLLSKLQESDRTIVNLYYIAEMNCEDIGKFLGVSPNTVRSRLHRARNKLRKEEAMIKENLSSFQLPTHTTENIMKKISQLKQATPSGSKPLVPLAVSAASAIIVMLLIGFGAQTQIRFQQPYSLESTSEQTIEIVDTQLVLDSPAEPSLLNKVGRSNIPSKSDGPVQEQDAQTFAAAQIDESGDLKIKQQWSDAKGPEGGAVGTLFKTNHGDVYTTSRNGLYRLTGDGKAWKLINAINYSSRDALTGRNGFRHVAEWQNTLYRAIDTRIFASTDRGATWKEFCECNKGELVGMVITGSNPGSESEMTIYLAYKKGVFRSENAGKSWTPLPEGISDRQIGVITNIENTVFVGTDKGLYRISTDKWELLSIDQNDRNRNLLPIIALEVAKNSLYVVTRKSRFGGSDPFYETFGLSMVKNDSPMSRIGFAAKTPEPYVWSIFRSDDIGNSWKTITPDSNNIEKKPKQKLRLSNIFPSRKKESDIPYSTRLNTTFNISAAGEKVMVISSKEHFYSTNAGKTWKSLDNTNDMGSAAASVFSNENTFYRSGRFGIYRTTDGGKSWHQFNTGFVNTVVQELIAVNGTLFANTRNGLVNSIDGGESWTPVSGDTGYLTRLAKFNGELYVRDDKIGAPRFFRFSTKDNRLMDISGIPAFKKVDFHKEVREKPIQNRGPIFSVPHGKGSFYTLMLGCFAVNNGTYYVEYMQKLFKWKPGLSEWSNTGLLDKIGIEKSSYSNNLFDSIGFKLTVSGETVYVGKWDGRLMKSIDEGNTWNDVTANLPFSVVNFRAIVFAGSFVYVSTDKGVVLSGNGTDWHTITNAKGTPLVMNRLVVNGATVYGESKQRIYQFNKDIGTWQEVTPEISYPVTCLAVDGNNLYVGTNGQGVLRFSLDN